MTLGEKLDFKTALAVTNQNRRRIFAARGGSESGFERIQRSPIPIELSAKFKVDRSLPVFTIGSCFARNVESALATLGVSCITSEYRFPDDLYETTGVGARNGALNAYTPASMLDLLRLSSRSDALEVGLLEVAPVEYCDMLLSGLRFLSGEQAREVRGQLIDCYSRVGEAGLVIVTLGYTESWFDTIDKIYVNRSPGANLRTIRKGDRYAFQNMSVLQVVDCLRKIVEAIRVKTAGQAKILLTTSPVPMHATFTSGDVITANYYSKCTLLTSAVLVASESADVDYFPSYEMITSLPWTEAWETDGVHPRGAVVASVMRRFIDAYF